MESYCLKCKSKREIKNTQEKKTKRGTKYLQGECTSCGKRVNRFFKKSE
jgi:Uri superfamily endonuclease